MTFPALSLFLAETSRSTFPLSICTSPPPPGVIDSAAASPSFGNVAPFVALICFLVNATLGESSDMIRTVTAAIPPAPA